MDKPGPKFVLRAMRPNGADADDPTFREALDEAKSDPALQAWHEREQAIDRAIAAKYREVRAPAHLRQQILSGAIASSRATSTGSRSAPAPQRLSRWRIDRPWATAFAALAAVASIVAAILVALPKSRGGTPFESIVASAFDHARQPVALTLYSVSPAELAVWLEKQNAPVPGEIPPRLAALETIGAKAIQLEGVPASQVCFRSPAELAAPAPAASATDPVIFLFTVHQRSCSGGTTQREPLVYSRDGHAVATWGDGGRLYVLIVRAPADVVREFLRDDGARIARLAVTAAAAVAANRKRTTLAVRPITPLRPAQPVDAAPLTSSLRLLL